MIFCIITHVPHGYQKESYFAYSPYVREMNVWTKYVDKVILVAPLHLKSKSAIDSSYSHNKIEFRKVSSFHIITLSSVLISLFKLPKIAFVIYKAMRDCDHIHLRCPGNMGLLGCIVQMFFPNKPKTAKYAGNWDLKASQPLSYRIQKWILRNTFLTRNMSVLVYGEWENSTKNIKPFFTASYKETDKTEVIKKDFNSTIEFVFVGSLTSGKNPLYAIHLVEQLHKKNTNVSLSIYGNGVLMNDLKNYIEENKLSNYVSLIGNKNHEEVKLAYQKSHFVILPSKSEGWPKVIAEGMFWGCLPIATKVSCVPDMLDKGERGLLLEMDLAHDVVQIQNLLFDEELYQSKVESAISWSRKYTLDYFEDEINKLLRE
jgi:glycosyltransferase involved in cell wall biosynthesis